MESPNNGMTKKERAFVKKLLKSKGKAGPPLDDPSLDALRTPITKFQLAELMNHQLSEYCNNIKKLPDNLTPDDLQYLKHWTLDFYGLRLSS